MKMCRIPTQVRPVRVSCLALAAVLIVLGGCGGGGTGDPPPVVEPPSSISYDESDVLYRVDAAIDPNLPTVEGGTPTAYSVSPTLPAGLTLGASTGILAGTPAAVSPPRDHVVVASNTSGQASAVVRIEVRWPPAKSLARAESPGDADLRHFLLRTHWGTREANYDALTGIGLEAYIDAMLAFAPIGTTQHEQQADGLLVRPTDPPGQEGMFPTRTQLADWWLTIMVLNPNTFQEVLAFHWHDHFATSSEVLGGGSTYWMKEHVNLFREKGAGNLRELLLGTCRDWAMLRWLDGITSTGSAPNENHAREWYELFALGVDNGYTQDDILETARAFTGYRQVVLDRDTGLLGIEFDARRHDAESKTIFGQTIPGQNGADDYQAIVDITIGQRDVAGWISRSLLERFCTEAPSPELVDQMSQLLRDQQYELAPVLKALFLSEAFHAAENRGTLVRSPAEMAIGFINATGLIIAPRQLTNQLYDLGQLPTQPPTVNGWPTGQGWLAAQGMIDRANLLESCITNRRVQADLGIDVADLLPPGEPDAREVVDALALRLGIEPSVDQRGTYVRYLETERLRDGTVVDSPFDVTNPRHVDDRVRGLLYVLGQHPTYQTR